MENTNSLKDLAMGVANNQITPNVAETEIPTAEDMKNQQIDDSVQYVGDTPVVIAPKKVMQDLIPDHPSNHPQFAFVASGPESSTGDATFTPTSTTPVVPTNIGLEDDSLNTPVMNIPLTPMGENNPNQKSVEPQGNGMSAADMDMLAELMPDAEVEVRVEIAKPIMETKASIVKDLIINMGFTTAEAEVAANNQIRKKISEAYQESKTKDSAADTGVVTINKTDDPNNLGLTREEHEKLEKVKKVRLVVVEDVDLANITIERPSEDHKADYIKSIEGSLSKYAVPMPMLGDFVSFRGAPMVQLVNSVNYEDSTINEIISTKASLVYEKLIGGTVIQKYDTNGKNIMSYQEFANKFPYQDLDMALYGILCASSMEESSTSLTCQACSHQWLQEYNLKSLLRLDGLSDDFKGRVDDILKFKSNDIEMRKLFESKRKAIRYKSPFTNNIYDLSYPTIARATNLLKRINAEDNVMTYLSAIALYLSRVLVYNESKNSYIEVTADETALLLETMKGFSNEDINMLAKQIHDDMYYTPQFILHSTCPSCGNVTDIPIPIEHLIFLIAQDSMVEIGN